MPNRDLEPPPGQDPEWDELYVARGNELPLFRPIYTGDIFSGVRVRTTTGREKTRPVAVVQHPCTMRSNGILRESLLVARVHQFNPLPRDQWHRNERLMPLPQLDPEKTSNQAHQAAFFEELYLVHPDDLNPENRIACLSEIGSYLLLQRWMFHSSRLAVPTWQIAEANSHVYEEADLIEMWCEEAADQGVALPEATTDADDWLGEAVGDTTRRAMLRQVGLRSQVRREMKQEAKNRYQQAGEVIPMISPEGNRRST